MPSSPPLDLCQDGEVCKSGADLIEVDVQAWLYGPLLFFFFFFFFFFFSLSGTLSNVDPLLREKNEYARHWICG